MKRYHVVPRGDGLWAVKREVGGNCAHLLWNDNGWCETDGVTECWYDDNCHFPESRWRERK